MGAIPTQIHRLRILLWSRLFIATFLLFYAQFVFRVERVIFYGIIAAVCFLSLVYLIWLVTGRLLKYLAWVQILFDLFLESLLVYYTGGADSLFVTIYALTILSASSVLSPGASFLIAAGASGCFIGAILTGYYGWVPKYLPQPDPQFLGKRDVIYLFYASYVQITVFFVVAVLAYFFNRIIKRLEEKIKTQERLVFLGEVTSSIAHEIRNPLASISGSIELLGKQLYDRLNEKQVQLMRAVVDESDRIKRIFSGLLDYARLSDLQLEMVVLEEFLNQVLLLMVHQPDYSQAVNVHRGYEGRNIRLKIDPEAMKQVLMNVITNAYQAMPEGGDLRIDVYRKRSEVVLTVADTGIGMDAKTISQLFAPFKTTKPNGTGLGLAEAQKIVSQHGGRIVVNSQKGKGTRVEIILPLVMD